MSTPATGRRRADLSRPATTDLPVLKPFNYREAGQPDSLLFSNWLAEFSPRSLAIIAAIEGPLQGTRTGSNAQDLLRRRLRRRPTVALV